MLTNSYYEKLKDEFMKHKDEFVEDNKLTALGAIFIVAAAINYLGIGGKKNGSIKK